MEEINNELEKEIAKKMPKTFQIFSSLMKEARQKKKLNRFSNINPKKTKVIAPIQNDDLKNKKGGDNFEN